METEEEMRWIFEDAIVQDLVTMQPTLVSITLKRFGSVGLG
jgi:hypothetical protein